MKNIIAASVDMLTTECDAFEYVAKYVYTPTAYTTTTYTPKTYQKKYVNVSFVPPNSVNIYSYYLRTNAPNAAGEVVIDEQGNYYRYNKGFGDVSSLSGVTKIEGAPDVAYNALAAINVPVFGY